MATTGPTGSPDVGRSTPTILGIRQVKIPGHGPGSQRAVVHETGTSPPSGVRRAGDVGRGRDEPSRGLRAQRAAARPGARSAPGLCRVGPATSSRGRPSERPGRLAAGADTLGSEHSGIVDRGVDGYHLDVADPDGTMIRFLAPADTGSARQAGVDAAGFIGVSLDDQSAPTFMRLRGSPCPEQPGRLASRSVDWLASETLSGPNRSTARDASTSGRNS